ncbi:hypothetical protein [Rhizobium phage RHph_X2_26]|nr:hypothetical protein [Rhizobium phage RHph_X2_26]
MIKPGTKFRVTSDKLASWKGREFDAERITDHGRLLPSGARLCIYFDLDPSITDENKKRRGFVYDNEIELI